MKQRTIKNWCLLRDDSNLRVAMKLRLKEINKAELCREFGIDVNNLNHQLEGTNPRAISQHMMWRICNKLGIRISVKIEFV